MSITVAVKNCFKSLNFIGLEFTYDVGGFVVSSSQKTKIESLEPGETVETAFKTSGYGEIYMKIDALTHRNRFFRSVAINQFHVNPEKLPNDIWKINLDEKTWRCNNNFLREAEIVFQEFDNDHNKLQHFAQEGESFLKDEVTGGTVQDAEMNQDRYKQLVKERKEQMKQAREMNALFYQVVANIVGKVVPGAEPITDIVSDYFAQTNPNLEEINAKKVTTEAIMDEIHWPEKKIYHWYLNPTSMLLILWKQKMIRENKKGLSSN